MDRAMFARLERLFSEARELAPSERFAFLDAHCRNDPELMHRLERLLMFDEGSPSLSLAADALQAVADAAVDSHEWLHVDPLVGSSIGPYRVIEHIGVGGFGDVYRAEQQQPVKREVALKILRAGMDSARVAARFEQERRALALMEHPGIAHVFDAGSMPADDSGAQERPYVVMELVKPGTPMTDWCDEQRLPLTSRLELFIAVCRAVQHAHHKGIIHRDLKPTNILMATVDGVPMPKIIDFGIAKALIGTSPAHTHPLADRTLVTEQRTLLGTPIYMSPEQLGGVDEQRRDLGTDVDTRSDVYSLGVLLYELLTGTTPFDASRLQSASYLELRQLLAEEQAERPSARVTRLAENMEEIGRASQVDARSLRRLLRGDLDWIVLKALEKDRDRRYASCSELAADMRRHLDHEPVLAGPPSAAYRVRKFVRRNRAGVAAAAAVCVAMVGATLIATRYALSEHEQRTIAEQATTVAERESAEALRQHAVAKAVNEFLTSDLLSAVRPDRMGKDVSMRDVLDAAAQRLDEASGSGGRFAEKPEIEAQIRHALGVTY